MKLAAKIGAIEIAGDEVRVVIVKTGGRAPKVLEARLARAEYADDAGRRDALTDAARRAVGAVKNRPAVYVLCASSEYSVVRLLSVPFKGRGRVSAAVPFELEPYLAFPIEDLVVDHNVVREVEGETEALAVGLRRDAVEEQLKVLEAAGVEVESVALDAAGLMALWQARRKNLKGLHMALHVRDTHAVLVVTNDRAPAFFRLLALTPKRFAEAPAPVAREVQNSVRSFTAQWKGAAQIEDLTVTGVELDPGQQRAFEERLDLPVVYERLSDDFRGAKAWRDVPKPSLDVDDAPESRSPNEDWAALIGVAMAAAGGYVAYEFRKGVLAPRNAGRRVMSHALFSAVLAVAIAVGYGVYCFVDYRNDQAELAQIGDEVWQLFTTAFPESEAAKNGRNPADRGGNTTMDFMSAEIEKLDTGDAETSVEVFTRPTLLDILQELSALMPKNLVTLNDLRIWESPSRSQRVTITGTVSDPARFNEVLENLKRSTILRVEEEPTLASKPGGETTFTITAFT